MQAINVIAQQLGAEFVASRPKLARDDDLFTSDAMRRLNASRNLARWRTATKAGAFLSNSFHAAKAAIAAAEGAKHAAALAASNAVVTQVKSATQLERLPWYEQGSTCLNSEETWARRLALRFTPPVRDVLEAFWIAALTSAQIADLRVTFKLYSHLPTRELDKVENLKPYAQDRMQLSDWDRMWRDLRPISWLRFMPIPHLTSIFEDWFRDREGP